MTDVIDDLTLPHPMTPLGTKWELVTDRVMGGVSRGYLRREEIAGRMALHMTGGVRLDNSGGFVQTALNLAPGGAALDARAWSGIALTVRGQGERYNMHLRTDDISRPWQSYRFTFEAGPDWTQLVLPFAQIEAHRVDAPFDARTLRRIGLVAIGREFEADLAISDVRFIA